MNTLKTVLSSVLLLNVLFILPAALLQAKAAGTTETQKYAKKLVTVKKTQGPDPYTGSHDKKNYIGKAAMSKKQVPIGNASK